MDKPQGFLDLDFKIRRAVLMLLYIVIFCFMVYIFRQGRPLIGFVLTVLSPFIVALIVAYIFNPIVTWLQRRFSLGRISGVLITYCLILGITAGFFAILLPILYTQTKLVITNIITNFPTVLSKTNEWLRLKVSPEELQQAKDFLRANFDIGMVTTRAGDAAGNVAQGAFDTTRLITRAVGTTVSVIVGFFALVTFVVVICFYFLLDYGRFEHIARVLLPDDKESRVFGIWAKIDSALGGFLRGQLIVATTIGVLYTVGLMMMGMKEYAILIGFLAGFGNMIPYMGPLLGGVPAGLWVLFGDSYDSGQEKLIGLGIIVAFSVAVQTLDGFFLQPRIVGKNAELHPLLVLLALLIGAQFGLGGMIIAVPLAIMVRVVLKELWWDPLEIQEYNNKAAANASKNVQREKTMLEREAAARPVDNLPVAAVATGPTEFVDSPVRPEAAVGDTAGDADRPAVKRRRRRKR